MAALKVHPKVYWIWNHRRWCLENIPLTPDDDSRRDDELDWRREAWTTELFITEKMLEADSRNCKLNALLCLCKCLPSTYGVLVMAWNYRRYVLASLPPPPANSKIPAKTAASELDYTQKKIEANFSNFSAWHQRSKVYDSTNQLKDASILDSGGLKYCLTFFVALTKPE